MLVGGAVLQMQLCTEQRQASLDPNRFPRWIGYRFPLGVCHSLRLSHTGAFVSLMSWGRWSHPQACHTFSGNHFPLPYSQHLHMKGDATSRSRPSYNLEHLAYESGWKNRLQRISFGYLCLTLLLQMFVIHAYMVYNNFLWNNRGWLPEQF